MGRKDRERYYVGLHQQAHNKLVGMLAIGESRDEGKRTGEDREKIYSYGTEMVTLGVECSLGEYTKANSPKDITMIFSMTEDEQYALAEEIDTNGTNLMTELLERYPSLIYLFYFI